METVLIDEKEFVNKYAEKAGKLNKVLMQSLREKERRAGINLNSFGGIELIMWGEDMDVETCMNNLFAAFGNNFAESAAYQTDNAKMMQMIEMIHSYLSDRGLIDDFMRYKARCVKTQPQNEDGKDKRLT